MNFGPDPWRQTSWDARAAANFMAGGAGAGLVFATTLAGGPRWLFGAGAALVALGLLSVFSEMGRPWRAANVVLHVRRSWMTREALVAPMLLGAAVAAAAGLPAASALAAVLALAFVFCQGRMLRAARGIPAWRAPLTPPLMVATGLAEGAGLWLALSGRPATLAIWGGVALALVARLWLWSAWRDSLGAAPRALAAVARDAWPLKTGTLLALASAVLVAGLPMPGWAGMVLQVTAGAVAAAGGLWFKFSLLTRASFNQGFMLPHLPVRGVRPSGP